MLHPAMLLADYNGNPQLRKFITELADGFLAHRSEATRRSDSPSRSDLWMTRKFPTIVVASCRFLGGVEIDRRSEIPRTV